MRCPHCASLLASRPVCLGCGLSIDLPATQPVLPGLEPTRVRVDPEPVVEALPGLEPTQRDGGSGPQDLPASDVSGAAQCPRCHTTVTGRFCDQCGYAVAARRPPRSDEEPRRVVCSECGVPNRAERERCGSCGRSL